MYELRQKNRHHCPNYSSFPISTVSLYIELSTDKKRLSQLKVYSFELIQLVMSPLEVSQLVVSHFKQKLKKGQKLIFYSLLILQISHFNSFYKISLEFLKSSCECSNPISTRYFFSEILMARKWRPVSFSRVRINHKNVLPRGLDGLVKISSNFNDFLISYYSEFLKINSRYFKLTKSLFNLQRGFGIGFLIPIFIPEICH